MSRPAVDVVEVVQGLFERLGVEVVAHGCVADAAFVDELEGPERDVIERAVEIRRNEFAGGRACAHASLDALGVARAPITARADRSPVWPPEAVGSITHSEGYCMAAASTHTNRSIGLDIEVVGRVTPEIAEITLSPAERRWVAATDRPDEATTAVFAVKEALYKAQHPATGSWLDFGDVQVNQTDDPERLSLELVGDVPAVAGLAWPLSARWTVIEPWPTRSMAVATVVV